MKKTKALIIFYHIFINLKFASQKLNVRSDTCVNIQVSILLIPIFLTYTELNSLKECMKKKNKSFRWLVAASQVCNSILIKD